MRSGDESDLVGADALLVRLDFRFPPTGLTLVWPCGTLQHTETLSGPGNVPAWVDVAGAASPLIFLPGTGQKFYRVAE